MMPAPADTAEHWFQVGMALRTQQRWSEAADAFRLALARDANNATAWCLLGMAEVNVGRYDVAEQAYQQALAVAPDHLETLICYSFLLNQRSRPQQAVELLQKVLSRAPQVSLAWLVLGHSYDLLGNAEAAETASRRAVELAPNDPAPRYQLANTLLFRWQLPEAHVHIRRLLEMQPNHADGWALLGLILRAFGRHEESLEALRRSLSLASNSQTHSKLLSGLQYVAEITPDVLLQHHREWDAVFGQPLAPRSSDTPHSALPAPRSHRPLRLGFLSADFGQHPTGFLIVPALERLDKQRCTIICYSDRVAEDGYTARMRAVADHWRVTLGMPHEALDEQIRRDELDILFELSGHFGERMPLVARKPAPIQISWFGYVGTTGLTAIDYLLADAHHVRPGEERWYSETVLRMPHDYACFQPPADAPEVTPLPALTNGYVTFGCFNNPAKFSSPLFDAWAEILRRVPNARLLLKFGWLSDQEVQEQLRSEFSRRGIAAPRLLIEAHSPQPELLATYGRIDLAIDTQPYSGGLTTCEAMWMGVPVITFPGKTFAGRHSVSHMTNAGYPQFIAADQPGYIDLAVAWANRLDELAAIRSRMREQVRQSPLCDAPKFAADLLTILSGLLPR